MTSVHPKRPPDIPALLALLHSYNIRYVLVGSVAALLYGAEVQPGDVDITPALDRTNLERLAALLDAIEARPADGGGRWEISRMARAAGSALPIQRPHRPRWIICSARVMATSTSRSISTEPTTA
jgi:hypothetical protein